MFLATLLLVALTGGSADAAEAGNAAAVDSVLERYVEALGGQGALTKAEVRSYRGTLVHDINWHEPPHQEVPFVADHRGKGTYRYAESADPDALLEVSPEDEDSKLDWLLHPQSALVIADYFPDLEVTGREIRDGHQVVVLESPHLPTSYWALHFDVETGLLNNIGYHWFLEDYRSVNGVLFPHRIVTGRSKGGSSTYVFTEVCVERFGY